MDGGSQDGNHTGAADEVPRGLGRGSVQLKRHGPEYLSARRSCSRCLGSHRGGLAMLRIHHGVPGEPSLWGLSGVEGVSILSCVARWESKHVAMGEPCLQEEAQRKNESVGWKYVCGGLEGRKGWRCDYGSCSATIPSTDLPS